MVFIRLICQFCKNKGNNILNSAEFYAIFVSGLRIIMAKKIQLCMKVLPFHVFRFH